tara:strand:- start:613 stop:804 length:192 start_codon:yes stop_codon:yes gene_type:complete
MVNIKHEMVKYWFSQNSKPELITDFKDIVNGKYSITMLRRDILLTWEKKDYDSDAEAKTIGVE